MDGVAAQLAEWPLFAGPWMNARIGTGVITLQEGSERVTLDFNTATVRTEVIRPETIRPETARPETAAPR